jgi:hypothetical protein
MTHNLGYQLYIMNLMEHFNIVCEISIIIWYYIFCMFMIFCTSCHFDEVLDPVECMMYMCTYLFTCYAHILVDLCNMTVSVC